MSGEEFVPLSLVPMLNGIFVAVAFLLTGVATTWPMLLGAAGAAVVAVIAIEAVRRLGKIEAGAAMGVIFTSMFAAGVLLLEQSDTSSVHLDVEHALYGNLESLIWLDATGWSSLLDPVALAGLPVELPRMAITLVAVALFIFVFWLPLKISTFDEGFAHTIGMRSNFLGLALVITAAIAAFDAVGSIIVIAMFICPPAAARLMTNQLEHQVSWSVLFATLAAIIGYVLAGYGPLWIGFADSVPAAGMIATVSGVILGITVWIGPHRLRGATAPMG